MLTFISLTAAILFLAILLVLVSLLVLYNFYGMINGAPFVPLSKPHVKELLALGDIRPGERLVDLGSGDGRILIAAAKQGAEAYGWEINPLLIWWSTWRARRMGLSKKVHIQQGNYWNKSLKDADIITLFLVRPQMKRLQSKLKKELKSGARILSYVFTFPDWKPIRKSGKMYLYVQE